jgi:UDP-N-acetyl-D-mannosaminuronic acid transferase (WecB/TagA/CpsF family)
MNGFRLLDTVIDPLAGEDIARRIRAALQEPETPALFLVTVNPEILLHAHEEESYRRVLESASLRLIDGMGVKIAALCGGKRAPRTTGRALVAALLDIAAEEGVSAHFVLKSDGLTGSVRLLECLGRRRASSLVSGLSGSGDS